MQHIIRLFVLFVLVWNLLSSSAQAAPSAYDFVKPSRFTSVELSPSGKYLAYLMVETEKYCLDDDGQMVNLAKSSCGEDYKEYRSTHVVKIYDLQSSQIITSIPVPINFLIDWLEWASDDRILASLRSPQTVGRRARGYARGASRVVSFPRTGGNLTPLFTGRGSMVRENRYMSRISNLLPSDPNHIIMPAQKDAHLDLWKVNVLNGNAELVEAGVAKTLHWFTDSVGKPVLRFDCKDDRCETIYVFSKSKSGDWTRIKKLNRQPYESIDNIDFWPIGATGVPNQYYMISREDDTERRSIRIFDVSTNSYVRTVFEHPVYDVGGSIKDLQTGEYAGVWYIKDRLTYKLLDETQQKHIDGLNKYFKNSENVRMLGYTQDKSKLLIYVTAPNNAGEYYLYDMKAMRVERLFRRNSNLADRLSTKTDILKIPTRDGQSITAYHSYASGKSISQQPLLVMPHGGPERRDDYDFSEWPQYFASRGYQVLQVNFRGSSGYGRKFAQAGYGEWGGVMQNDLTDAVKHLQTSGKATPNSTCIVGYSYGGYAALYGGASTPELYRCIVSGGGVSDILADLKRTKVDAGADSYLFEYWEKSMGSLKTDKDKLKAVSPKNLADAFKAPVLLIHGEYDSVVNRTQSEDMAKALKRAGKQVEYIELKDEGHSNWEVETHILYLESIEAFLQKHLR